MRWRTKSLAGSAVPVARIRQARPFPIRAASTKPCGGFPPFPFQGSRARMIRLDNISKQNGHQIVFIEASAALQKGEKIGLVGPNGSGKTTLFRLITGEDAPDEGQVVGRSRRDHRLLQPGRRRDGGPQRGRRGDGRRGPGRRSRRRTEGAGGRDGGPGPRGRDGRASSRSTARCSTASRSSTATRWRAARAKCCRGLSFSQEMMDGDVGSAFGRLEDARRARAHPADAPRRDAARRAEQPSRSRKPDLAGAVPARLRGRAA